VVLLILIFECAFSAALAPFKYYAIEELARFLAYFLSIFLLYNVVQRRLELEFINWTIVLMMFIAIVYGIMQRNDLDFVAWGQPVYVSTMGNANFFAAVLVMVIPFILGLIFSRRDLFSAFLLVIVYILGALCLFWTKTRSAWYGFLVAHMVFVALQLLFGPLGRWLRNWKHIVYLLVGILIIGTLFQVLIAPRIAGEIDEFLSGISFEGRTNRVRLVMWIGSLKLLAEKPVFGHGIGAFQLVFGRYRPSYYHRWGTSHNSRHAHNEYLEVLLEQGLVGLIVFLFFYATLAWSILKTLRQPLHRYWKQMLIGLAAGLCGSMIDNGAAPHLRWTSTGTTFFFMIGVAFVVIKMIARHPNPAAPPAPLFNGQARVLPRNWVVNKNPLRFIVYTVFVGLIITIGVQEWKIVRGDYWLKRGEISLRSAGSVVTAATRPQWNDALNCFTESIALNPWNHSALYKIGYINLQHGRYSTSLHTQLRDQAKQAGDHETLALLKKINAAIMPTNELIMTLMALQEKELFTRVTWLNREELIEPKSKILVLLQQVNSNQTANAAALQNALLERIPYGQEQQLKQMLESIPTEGKTVDQFFQQLSETLNLTPLQTRLLKYFGQVENPVDGYTDADAQTTYHYLISIAPNYAQIHNNTGLLYQNLGKLWDAAREFSWATRLENNYKNQEHIGNFLMMPPIQDTYRATTHFSRMEELALEDWYDCFYTYVQYAVNNNPGIAGLTSTWLYNQSHYSRVWTLRGNAWQFAGNTLRARYFYKRALAWNPKDYEAILGLAREAAKAGQNGREIGYYAEIINRISPDEVSANQQWQRVMGMTINALHPHLEKAPDNAALWDIFGWAWFKYGGRDLQEQRNSLSQAYQYCMRAHELNPNLPNNLEHIRTIEAMGRELMAAGPAPGGRVGP